MIKTDVDNKQAQKELNNLERQIEKTQEDIDNLENKRKSASKDVLFKGAELDAEKAKLAELKAQLSEIRAISKDMSLSVDDRNIAKSKIPALQEAIKDQQTRVSMLQQEYNKIENSVTRYDQKLAEANEKLDKQTERAGELIKELTTAPSLAEKMSQAQEAASKSMGRTMQRIGSTLKSALVFSTVYKGLSEFRSWLWKVIQANEDATAAIANLKGSLLTLVQPIVNIIIPAFTTLVNILAKVVNAIARFISMLFGTTISSSAKAAKSLYNEVEALSSVGGTAEAAAGSLAGFDEINTITTENTGGGGGGVTSGTAPDFSSVIGGELDKIATLVGGALLALGAILTFSGINIPLGLTLMAIGALTLASVIAENWGAISQALQGPLGVLTALLSGALLVLGAIFTFSGANIPLGIGLMIAGAAGLAMTIAANWNTIVAAMQGPIGSLVALLSTAFLVIGAILAFSGANIPLGIGLMIAGAAGMVAYAVINWDTISQALEGPVGTIIGLLSGALLVVGSVLLFSGANVPLGLGLLAVGAAGLATTMAANWDHIEETLQGPVGAITAMISAALLVLGAILAFSGVATPLGIGLLAVGAVGLATSIAANWDKLNSILGGKIATITALVSAALLVLGVILLFSGVAAPLGFGLLIAGGAALAATVAPNWDFILEAIKGAWKNIKNWWSTNAGKYFTLEYWKDLGKDMINGLLEGLNGIFSGISSWASDVWSSITGIFSKKNAKASISGSTTAAQNAVSATAFRGVSIQNFPALATGAVIPPNREFMAVLGDQSSGYNIEAPESLIRKIVREETGGSNTELLQAILEAIRAGQVIKVDGRELGRTAVKSINNMTVQSGKPVLIF